ncbi:MBL fold metallo-hydrolase [Sandaracinus amylolyticus]|uniref:Diflavin flavoprotein n=1 Tax=Sandaracinus amylolyticus TaxID=927083 RepID=A0A0F6SDA7_9BACT|nr:MBL fold metallo-hydrolase [Sandaracinus amylolyticus]AKF03114.1 Diflavin flavoprotein [Sandaracinus amylolyticus]
MLEPIQKITPRTIGADVDILSSFYPVPGLGLVPINAFVLRAKEPVLVDTGYVAGSAAYLDAVRAAIDPRDLRWIWLTHADPDHIGALRDVLAEAPDARLVTTFLGLGKLGLYGPIPPERVFLLNPGQSLDVGDRELLALRPPTYDAPETTAFFDPSTRTLFSSDSFGAVLSKPVESANELGGNALREGEVTWATIDSPWLGALETPVFERSLSSVRALAPERVLSTHLPPAFGILDALLDNVRAAHSAPPFVGPDQPAFARMLAPAPPPMPEPLHA